jgi:alkanesulfonate monooxygenase SsuD/methylene tetrahydromethanopterin reductase-like flavin-dependent oxidoreductase (luciferase family)
VPTEPIPFYCGGKSPAAMRRTATLCQGYMGPGHSMNEIPGLLAELNRLRAEAGRENEPFETIVPVLPPNPVIDTYKRLEDMGVTATFLPPFDVAGIDRGHTSGLGRQSSIDAKKRQMEHYAETIIRRMG